MQFKPYDFVQILLPCGTNNFLKECKKEFRLPMSASASVARKSSYGKLTAKVDFPMLT